MKSVPECHATWGGFLPFHAHREWPAHTHTHSVVFGKGTEGRKSERNIIHVVFFIPPFHFSLSILSQTGLGNEKKSQNTLQKQVLIAVASLSFSQTL